MVMLKTEFVIRHFESLYERQNQLEFQKELVVCLLCMGSNFILLFFLFIELRKQNSFSDHLKRYGLPQFN